MEFPGYSFYENLEMYRDFQVCISVTLTETIQRYHTRLCFRSID